MKELFRENNSSGTNSPFMATESPGKSFTRIVIASQGVWKITWTEESLLIRRQVVQRNYSEEMPEEQKQSFDLHQVPKNEQPALYGYCCSSDQKIEKLSI